MNSLKPYVPTVPALDSATVLAGARQLHNMGGILSDFGTNFGDNYLKPGLKGAKKAKENYAKPAGSWFWKEIQEHPYRTAIQVVTIVPCVAPVVVTSPVLGVLGFGIKGESSFF